MTPPITTITPKTVAPPTWVERVQAACAGRPVNQQMRHSIDILRQEMERDIRFAQRLVPDRWPTGFLTDDMIEALYLLLQYRRQVDEVLGAPTPSHLINMDPPTPPANAL